MVQCFCPIRRQPDGQKGSRLSNTGGYEYREMAPGKLYLLGEGTDQTYGDAMSLWVHS